MDSAGDYLRAAFIAPLFFSAAHGLAARRADFGFTAYVGLLALLIVFCVVVAAAQWLGFMEAGDDEPFPALFVWTVACAFCGAIGGVFVGRADLTARNEAVQQAQEALHAQAALEVEANDMQQELWAEALAQCDGSAERAKPLYIKMRAQALWDEALQDAEEGNGEKRSLMANIFIFIIVPLLGLVALFLLAAWLS
ncbi:MAG: hypothetical protein IJR28_02785 [Ottowia sp.]|nr:hypothetical protein [Ottowia sp.]